MSHTESSKPYNFRRPPDPYRPARASLEVFGGAPQSASSKGYAKQSPADEAFGGAAPGVARTGRSPPAAAATATATDGRRGAGVERQASEGSESSGKSRDQIDRWLSAASERDASAAKQPPQPAAKQPLHPPARELSRDFFLDEIEPSPSPPPPGQRGRPPSPETLDGRGEGEENDGGGGDRRAEEPEKVGAQAQAQAPGPQWLAALKAGADGRTAGAGRTSEASEAGSVGSPSIPRLSKDLRDALGSFQQTFVVSDASKPDYPILYASAGFFKMTGYPGKEVIGRNCRFLQGEGTDPNDIAKIRTALKEGKSFCGRILNYKRDGTPFWNLLTISPIKDQQGKVLKYIGMQVEVSKYTEGNKATELRPNGMPASLIKYDARQQDRAASSVQELVGALRHPESAPEARSPPRKSTGGGAPPLFSYPPLKDELQLKVPSRFSTQIGAPFADKQYARPTKSESATAGSKPGGDGSGSGKNRRTSAILQLIRKSSKPLPESLQADMEDFNLDSSLPTAEERTSLEDEERAMEIRRGMDLATTLERIEKNFVITDPRLPDNPIIFASDHFLELTEYSREEIIGRNCRFLQGADTDMGVVRKISDAIKNQQNITVQLLNYTKTGKPFWNLFHLEAMKDSKGELQYFIGVQLDGSEHIEPIRRRMSEKTEHEGKKLVQSTAKNVDGALRDLPDANMSLEDLWASHSRQVLAKPHSRNSTTWHAMREVLSSGDTLGLNHFRPVKPLGCGDTGSVHLVELRSTTEFYAMKAMEKSVMLNRNKVHRARVEREILEKMDHPFLPTLYGSFQTRTHVCLITDFCPGGELFLLLERQPQKRFSEESARFYAAEIVLALEYLHCQGVIYRDLKPENVLIQRDGHVQLTDFDLSILSSSRPQMYRPPVPTGRKKRHVSKESLRPVLLTEPHARSNSFVGTEEYIAPEIILGLGHSSAVDWWALGILLYEMLYGRTPFRGRNRQRTFANVLHKDLNFPASTPISNGARQVIRGLLQREPKERLGSDKGANDLKSHPFFEGIDWPLIRRMTPPPLETPVYHIDKDADAKDLDWEDGDPGSATASFDDTF